MSLEIDFNGKKISVKRNTKIYQLLPQPNRKKYFAAKVNSRVRELTYEIVKPCKIELLDLTMADGVSVYRTSLRYLIAMAFYKCYPSLKFSISYSISRCLYITLDNKNPITSDMIENVKNMMDKIVKKDLPFNRIAMTNDKAKEIFTKLGYQDKVDLLKYRPENGTSLYSCNGYWNYMNGRMVPSSGYLKFYLVKQYTPGMLVQYPRPECGGTIPKFEDAPIFGKTLKESEKWAEIIGITTVPSINERIKKDGEVDFISLCESRHARMLSDIGDFIENKIDEVKLICVAGPSSSGKTTFANRLRIELMSRGIDPIRISLDDYYLPRNECPKDEDGNYDLESIHALDIELFNKNMLDLISGKKIQLPHFNFKTLKREYKKYFKLKENQPIIVEGIHALNNEMTRDIPTNQKYKIFISPASIISFDGHNPVSLTNIRLIRRIVRDFKFRNATAEHTLNMWPSVRKGEFKWIYQTQECADYVFNSLLPYEPAVLKKYALPLLKEIGPDSVHHSLGTKLIRMLKYFVDLNEKWIPCNSIMREFIGGSCFEENDEVEGEKN